MTIPDGPLVEAVTQIIHERSDGDPQWMPYDRETACQVISIFFENLDRVAMAMAACCGDRCKNDSETCVANAILPDIDAAIAAAKAAALRDQAEAGRVG